MREVCGEAPPVAGRQGVAAGGLRRARGPGPWSPFGSDLVRRAPALAVATLEPCRSAGDARGDRSISVDRFLVVIGRRRDTRRPERGCRRAVGRCGVVEEEEGARRGSGRETAAKAPVRSTKNRVVEALNDCRQGLSSRPLRRRARARAPVAARRGANGHAAHLPLSRRPRGHHGHHGRRSVRGAPRLRGCLPRGRVPVRARRAQHPRADPCRQGAALVAANRRTPSSPASSRIRGLAR